MNVRYKKSFEKDLKKIKDKRVLRDLKTLLTEIKSCGNILEFKNIKKLSGHQTAYRIRLGNYRIGFFMKMI